MMKKRGDLINFDRKSQLARWRLIKLLTSPLKALDRKVPMYQLREVERVIGLYRFFKITIN